MAGVWLGDSQGFPMCARPLQRRIGHNSSQVTKGRSMFVEFGDARLAWARRWNDLVLMHASDLGGYETLSEAQISICRRVATLECELESMEGRKSAGVPIEIEVYGRLAGRLCRLLELIGSRNFLCAARRREAS